MSLDNFSTLSVCLEMKKVVELGKAKFESLFGHKIHWVTIHYLSA